MGDLLTRSYERARSALAQIGAGQRITIGLLLVGLVLGGVFFVRWITTPTYAPLYSNLASTDASAIVEELNASSVKYELADGGQTIMVDRDLVYDTRLAMSAKGLPAGDATGYALLDKKGITTSEFQQHIDYQRALESEMAMTLEALDGVRTAVVHVALPKEEVFVTETSKPTASVLLDLSPGTTLTSAQIQAVTNLVSSSIEGMSPAEVTVADNTGRVLSAAGSEFGASGGASDAQSQMEQDYENRLAKNAQQILDRIVGPGQAVVKVGADLDFDARETQTKTYTKADGTPALSESTTKETYTGTGAAVGGVLGPDAQPGGASGQGNKYNKSQRTVNNSVGETMETTKDAPGSVDRLTVSVVLDAGNPASANTSDIEALVSNAVGLDKTRGDAITVSAMALDTTAAEEAAKDIAEAEAEAKRAEMMSMIRTAVIAGLILLIGLVSWWRSRKKRKRAPVRTGPGMTAEQALELDAIRAQIVSQPPSNIADEEVARRQQVRSEIATMISDNPDEVTAMLRGWLAEEKA